MKKAEHQCECKKQPDHNVIGVSDKLEPMCSECLTTFLLNEGQFGTCIVERYEPEDVGKTVTPLNSYQRKAARTGYFRREGYTPEEYAVTAMGLAGEAGEVVDVIKKAIRDRDQKKGVIEVDLNKLREELGDLLWYVANVARMFGIPLEDVGRENIAKLQKRYPEGFNTVDAKARKDEVAK